MHGFVLLFIVVNKKSNLLFYFVQKTIVIKT